MKLTSWLRRAAPSQGTAAEPAMPGSGAVRHIELDYPVSPRCRFGHGLPPHPELTAIIGRNRDRYLEHVRSIVALADDLARIPLQRGQDPSEPAWVNDWLPGFDAAALYMFVATQRPQLYLEVGSGTSTTFVRRAVRDHGLPTRLVSIDPQPRSEIDALCDEVVRQPLEDVDLSVFDTVAPGDIVFVDNSHRVLPNSDATVVFLEVLPRLPAGVLVHLHDIWLPDDYPPQWADRFYSEQYVLAGFLLGGAQGFETELPAWYVINDPEAAGLLGPLWDRLGSDQVERHGGSYWLRTR